MCPVSVFTLLYSTPGSPHTNPHTASMPSRRQPSGRARACHSILTFTPTMLADRWAERPFGGSVDLLQHLLVFDVRDDLCHELMHALQMSPLHAFFTIRYPSLVSQGETARALPRDWLKTFSRTVRFVRRPRAKSRNGRRTQDVRAQTLLTMVATSIAR